MNAAPAPTGAPSAAVEDYVKAIYAVAQSADAGSVTTNALAERLGVQPASASAMLRTLADRGLVTRVRYRGAQLTPKGSELALSVIRRHRLIELFLTRELGMSWDQVHAEAEALEHAASPRLIEVIAAKLGHPTHDPHGAPIPTGDGDILEHRYQPLNQLTPGQSGVLCRVEGAGTDMLSYLGDRGIALGCRLTLVAVEPFGGAVTVDIENSQCELSPRVAQHLRLRT